MVFENKYSYLALLNTKKMDKIVFNYLVKYIDYKGVIQI